MDPDASGRGPLLLLCAGDGSGSRVRQASHRPVGSVRLGLVRLGFVRLGRVRPRRARAGTSSSGSGGYILVGLGQERQPPPPLSTGTGDPTTAPVESSTLGPLVGNPDQYGQVLPGRRRRVEEPVEDEPGHQ